MIIREFKPSDYKAAVELWSSTEGVELAEGDSEESILKYLARNPGLSKVAIREGNLIGAVLCGHDGRRGFIYHLAVKSDERGYGVGKRIVQKCLEDLKTEKIERVLILVDRKNNNGLRFWTSCDWDEISRALPFGTNI
jgi:ribosomal protein S18 acetylase RimI-like enzyme